MQPEYSRCLLCGVRGNADALANLILFAPLGAALALNGRIGIRAVLGAGILSCCVELAQIMIPGRDPSLGDVCFNTIGAAVGQGLFLLGGRWLTPARNTAARLSLAAAVAAAGVFAFTGYLVAPSLPAPPYVAWWTADRPELAWYPARVLAARLGTHAIRPGDRPRPSEVRSLLIGETPLWLEAVAGPRPSSLGPLLHIEDRWRREVLLVGADRDDVVLRYRTRSAQLRLDRPDIRMHGALAGIAGEDTLRIVIHRDAGGFCLGVNAVHACRLWFTIGSAWALLLYPPHFRRWEHDLLDAGWVAGLLLPVGLWIRRRPESMVALGLVLSSLAVLPQHAGLNPTPMREWIGAGCGLLIGAALQVVATRRSRAPHDS